MGVGCCWQYGPCSLTAGGAPCAVPALCEKEAILDPFSPMATVTAITTVFPDTGLLRFSEGPKTQIMSQNELCFTLKMPDCCPNLLFCLVDMCFPGGGWLSGWWRERWLTIGPCARAV